MVFSHILVTIVVFVSSCQDVRAVNKKVTVLLGGQDADSYATKALEIFVPTKDCRAIKIFQPLPANFQYPIVGAIGNKNYVCGSSQNIFSCYELALAGFTGLMQSFISHQNQPGVVVGSKMYIMDNYYPEFFDGTTFSGADGANAMLPPPRVVGPGSTMVALGTTGFYVFGGVYNPTSVMFYTIGTNTWKILNPMPTGMAYSGAILITTSAGTSTFLVAQNVFVDSPVNPSYIFTVPSATAPDGTWAPVTTDVPNDNLYGAMFFTSDGSIYAFGGGFNGPSNKLRKYDVNNRKWTASTEMLSPRRFGAAITITIDDAGLSPACPGL